MGRMNEPISFVHSVEYIRVLIAILKSMYEITRVAGIMSYDRANSEKSNSGKKYAGYKLFKFFLSND